MPKDKIKWTDKVQATASIIAILAALVGFYKLFTADKNLQKQIDDLSQLANQSIIQSQIMREELEISRTRNTMLLEQLGIDQAKWEKQISPDFSMDFSSINGWGSAYDSTRIEGVSLINNGGSCHITKLVINKSNNCKLTFPLSHIPSQSKVKFNMSFSEKSDIMLDVNLVFVDSKGTTYSQRFRSEKTPIDKFKNQDFLNIKISEPVKLLK